MGVFVFIVPRIANRETGEMLGQGPQATTKIDRPEATELQCYLRLTKNLNGMLRLMASAIAPGFCQLQFMYALHSARLLRPGLVEQSMVHGRKGVQRPASNAARRGC
jgi:hypothetical protein